jgi:predicted ATP-binding protein involved in virulence
MIAHFYLNLLKLKTLYMLLPENFPYITAIHVNDCYAIKDLDIPLKDYKPFSHLILTGKNGSGKTSILRAMDYLFRESFLHDEIKHITIQQQKEYERLFIVPFNTKFNSTVFYNNVNRIIYSFLVADRETSIVANVINPTKEDYFVEQIMKKNSSEYFIKQSKQYLVNQVVSKAFAMVSNDKKEIQERQSFLDSFQFLLATIFEDKNLELVFIKESYDFYLQLSDGRRQDFNTLSDGFSAFVSILMDLLIRTDLIRKQVGDFSYHPCGIVLIDEPETHLHLELQYQVLPILTTFFPNIQFIVATHSPAVISSIKNATVFDLTKKDYEKEEVAGKSYSELMISHFGLENEFSPIADNIFDSINQVLKDHKDNKPVLKQKLQEILNENEKYLSAGMRLEIESMIIENS